MNSREYSREFYERFEAEKAYFENILERILRRKKRIIRAGQPTSRIESIRPALGPSPHHFRQKRRSKHVKFNSYNDFFHPTVPSDRESSDGIWFRLEFRTKSSPVGWNSIRPSDSEISIIIIIFSIYNYFCYMDKNIKFDCLSRLSLSNINFQKWNFQFSVL